jgi:hypothetical protein
MNTSSKSINPIAHSEGVPMTRPVLGAFNSPGTTSSPLEQQIIALLAQREVERILLSGSRRRRASPAHKQLLALGARAIPTLLRRYHRAPRTLDLLLRQITGASASDGLRNVEEMRLAWIDWARSRNHLM